MFKPSSWLSKFQKSSCTSPQRVINPREYAGREAEAAKKGPSSKAQGFCQHLRSVATFLGASFTFVAVGFRLFVCLMCLLTYHFHFSSVPRGEFLSPSTGGKFLKPASQPSPPPPWPPGQWLLHRWQEEQLPVSTPSPQHIFPDVECLLI